MKRDWSLTAESLERFLSWLASDRASFLTGQTIVLDGGLTIVSPLARLGGAPESR